MSHTKVAIKPAYHQELRKISSSVSAFSIAIVLVWLQGSLVVESHPAPWPILFFLIAAPICTASSFLSFIVSHREHVSRGTDKALDWFMALGVGLGNGGFLGLLVDRSVLTAIVFVVAIILAVIVFWLIGRSMDEVTPESDTRQES